MTVPWLDRMTLLLGLYEAPGDEDNPAILAMAKFCGGNIAKTYTNDEIPWCALTANYCLQSAGLDGNDSLWALDFRKYGKQLSGPAVGAIATKTRARGGHVFFVVGRTADGKIVGRGGNQSNMVCDEIFSPSVLSYNWPAYPTPLVGFSNLPIVKLEPATRKIISIGDAMTKTPLSIKYNNPGAMWGGARATKWGATDDLKIGDKQGNHIAVFPTKVQGAAAQFDLWRTGYTGLTLSDAIKKWSGDNSTTEYLGFLRKNAMIAGDEKITESLLSGPRGLQLMKAQAHWEAGKAYPMTDAEWQLAQNMVFSAQPAPPDVEKPEPDQETKPAVKSSEIWAAILTFISTAGSLLTDWKFLLFIGIVLTAYLVYRRYTREDISGLFK